MCVSFGLIACVRSSPHPLPSPLRPGAHRQVARYRHHHAPIASLAFVLVDSAPQPKHAPSPESSPERSRQAPARSGRASERGPRKGATAAATGQAEKQGGPAVAKRSKAAAGVSALLEAYDPADAAADENARRNAAALKPLGLNPIKGACLPAALARGHGAVTGGRVAAPHAAAAAAADSSRAAAAAAASRCWAVVSADAAGNVVAVTLPSLDFKRFPAFQIKDFSVGWVGPTASPPVAFAARGGGGGEKLDGGGGGGGGGATWPAPLRCVVTASPRARAVLVWPRPGDPGLTVATPLPARDAPVASLAVADLWALEPPEGAETCDGASDGAFGSAHQVGRGGRGRASLLATGCAGAGAGDDSPDAVLGRLCVAWVTQRGGLCCWTKRRGLEVLADEAMARPAEAPGDGGGSVEGGGGGGGGGSQAHALQAHALRCGVALCGGGRWLIAWGRHDVAVYRRVPTNDKGVVPAGVVPAGSAADPTADGTRRTASLPVPSFEEAARVRVRCRGVGGGAGVEGAVVGADVREGGRLVVVTADGWAFDFDLALC